MLVINHAFALYTDVGAVALYTPSAVYQCLMRTNSSPDRVDAMQVTYINIFRSIGTL